MSLNGAKQVAQSVISEPAVLAALQDEGPEVQFVAFGAAGKDFFRGQTVALAVVVAVSDAAVQAVIFADVADFNQTPDKDGVSVDFLPCLNCQLCKRFGGFRGPVVYQKLVFFQGQAVVFSQLFNQLIHWKKLRSRRF